MHDAVLILDFVIEPSQRPRGFDDKMQITAAEQVETGCKSNQ